MGVVQERLHAGNVHHGRGPAAVVTEHRSATGEHRRILRKRRRFNARKLEGGFPAFPFRLELGNHDDHDENASTARDIPGAGLNGTAVVDSLQIQHISRTGAHDDDRSKDDKECRRDVDGDDPGLHHGCEDQSAEQHGEPGDHQRSPLCKHLHRHKGVQGQCDSRHHTPKASLLR